MKAPSLAVLILCAGAVTAAADVVVTVESKDLAADPPVVESQTIYMTADKLAADGFDSQGGKITMVYRGDRGVLWSIDHGSKAYVELDKVTITKMAGQLDASVKQMQEQMAQMPEDQRKVVEQMMQKQMGTKKKPVMEIKDAGAKQTIDGKPCNRYDVTVDGVKTAEVWAASWKDAGVHKESFEAFRGMANFLQSLVDASPALANAVGQEGGMFQGVDKVDGCPVLIRQLKDGKVVEETAFKSAQEKSVEPARFEVPAGYEKQQLGQ